MREIWMMQTRFEKRVGSAPFGLTEQPRFRAAFDFMRLRAEIGEVDEVLADWWEEFSLANDNLRNDMVDAVRMEQQQRPKVARAPRVQKALPQTEDLEAVSPGTAESSEAPKKRRRRRRPTGRGPGEGSGQA
jgi:poly(A) polymerase